MFRSAFTPLVGIACFLFSTSCDRPLFQIGPAYPQKNGQAFLQKHGHPAAAIDAVVNYRQLTPAQIAEFGKSNSVDVRYLVARNPCLKPEEIDAIINDSSDFVRSGAACNPNLTIAQMQKLFSDPSHTVYCQLAGNASVPEEMLLRLHKQRDPGLVFFAMNPKCPGPIREEIRRNGDDLAKRWLQTTEERNPR